MRAAFALTFVLAASAGCAVGYHPPEWIQGTWQTPPREDPTTYSEWEFTEEDVFYTEVLYGEVAAAYDYSEIPYGEEVSDGEYVLENSLGDVLTFSRTDDDDVIVWTSEGPQLPFDTQTDLHRVE